MPAEIPFKGSPWPTQSRGQGAEKLRRGLLGLIVALVVARPLVHGEDPGLLADSFTWQNGLVLNLFWLVGAVGWAAYRYWSGQGKWYSNLVELGFLITVILIWTSAACAASYKHPAWLIAWEWLIFLVAFCLVRQLAQEAGDMRRILCALLATGISLSAFGIYQYAFDRHDNKSATIASLVLTGTNIDLDASDNVAPFGPARASMDGVTGPFFLPSSFAAYLILGLPLMVAWLGATRKIIGWSWIIVLMAGCTLLMLIVLPLTKSWTALIGTGLVALAYFGEQLRRHRGFAWLVMVFATFACLLLAGLWMVPGRELLLRSGGGVLSRRCTYLTVTWNMISDPKHPLQFWLGVGPGNFVRFFGRYMAPTAFEEVSSPQNWVLEISACCGILTAGALVATLAYLFWHTRSFWRHEDPTNPVDRVSQMAPKIGDDGENHEQSTRWEFYLGGMAGLIVGFVLSVPAGHSDEILMHGLSAGARSIIWFAAFALLEAVPYTRRALGLGIMAGLTAFLVALLGSAGIDMPAVAQPFWIMAAIALNMANRDNPRLVSCGWLRLVWPLPALLTVCIIFLLWVFIPVQTCGASLNEAARGYQRWQTKFQPQLQKQLENEPDVKNKQLLGDGAFNQLKHTILVPLQNAAQSDPTNAYPFLELAHWYGETWKYWPKIEIRRRALMVAERARVLDPEGKAAYVTEYQLNMLFASMATTEKTALYRFAAQALKQAVDRDPTNCRLRYRLAEALFLAENRVQGEQQARKSLEFDELLTNSLRRLSEAQREQIQSWLNK